MNAPLIHSDRVTVTVTDTVASDLIARAGLGSDSDDRWHLRDGTTTTDPQQALTDALVTIAEGEESPDWA